jgi:hypothetical protein
MTVLRTVSFPDAEWSGVQAGGVLGMFNGKERPLKYMPDSKLVKYFGMASPEEELTRDIEWEIQQSPGVDGELDSNSTYTLTFVEVDTTANQGSGLRSGIPVGSVGVEMVPLRSPSGSIGPGGDPVSGSAHNLLRINLPDSVVNTDTTELWVYSTTAGGVWPTAGRIARAPAGVRAFTWNGIDETDENGVIITGSPDFDYPLDIFRNMAPAKTYPAKMNRRLLLWGSEELESTFSFTAGSVYADWTGGDEIDHGVIGMVAYPDGEGRGYVVKNYYNASPGQIELDEAFVGANASYDTHGVTTRLCRPSGQLSFSEPDDYENFPLLNNRYVELSAADPETGMAVVNGRGLAFTVHKTFGVDFNISPASRQGTIIEISTQVGCLSHRTVQDIGGTLIWLSESGLAASSGGAPVIISDEVSPEFDAMIREQTGRVRDAFAVNWAAKKKYMCFIPVDGDDVGCSRCIVLDYNNIPGEPRFKYTVYSFSKEFTNASIERHEVLSGSTTTFEEYPVFGDPDGYTWSFGIGNADGPDSGSVSGTITSAGTSPQFLTDSSAAFDTDGIGLAGMIVTIRRTSDGQTQEKLIASNSGDTIFADQEWSWEPSAGDTFWIGGISSYYETPWSSLGGNEGLQKLHSLVSTHKVEDAGELQVDVYEDFSSTPYSRPNEGETIDLTKAAGRGVNRLSGHRCYHTKIKYSNHLPGQGWTLKNSTLITSQKDEPR